MKAKKKSGSTKGKSSGKRAVKDLPAHTAQSVKGGAPVTALAGSAKADGTLDAGIRFKYSPGSPSLP